eukprot:TRINITY_DN63530_c0_g1_i1.p1 TRINITY_DN63530_c0_g1~~TRINITY_DN63530_c0_g1_i1.p1  ORF type:complete len:182 (-),score=30.06 TRINITY_DN63530_c0_g1_i1:32-529(-)
MAAMKAAAASLTLVAMLILASFTWLRQVRDEESPTNVRRLEQVDVFVQELRACCPAEDGTWHSCCSVAGQCCAAGAKHSCCPGPQEDQLLQPCIGEQGRTVCAKSGKCCDGLCCSKSSVCCGKVCCSQETSCCKDALGSDICGPPGCTLPGLRLPDKADRETFQQ